MGSPICMYEEDGEVMRESAWPLVRDRLWRPWYAKIWWIGIALFWVASGLLSWMHFDIVKIDEPYDGCIPLLLNPVAATLTLGVGVIRSLLMQPAAERADHYDHYDQGNAATREDGHVIALRSSLLHPNRANALSNPNNPLSPSNSHRAANAF